MKNKMILAILVAFGVLGSLLAQPQNGGKKRPPEFNPERALVDLKQKLDLNDKQTNEVKSILFNAEKENLNLRETNADAHLKEMEAHKKVMENAAEKITKLLNDDQKAVFEKMQKERKELPPPPPRG